MIWVPESPATSINLPISNQLLNQKRVSLPLWISDRRKVAACCRSLRSLRHIHDPDDLSLTSQKQRFRNRFLLVQATQRESEFVSSLHIRHKAKTRDVPAIHLMPRPPSFFGLHTSSHETFSLVVEFGDPDHRKALHMLSIVSRHRFGRRNTEHQKLANVFAKCKEEEFVKIKI